MKHINKKTIRLLLCLSTMLCIVGCGKEITYEKELNSTAQGAEMGVGVNASGDAGGHFVDGFASDLVATVDQPILDESVDRDLSAASLLFCLDNGEILYQNNVFTKLNPASTTKLLTAYTALKYGDLDSIITVSENALRLEAGSSVAGFAVGDQISLGDALYGLMLPSGNDAATAIAESVSGSVDAFCELMNQEARALGATSTHYVNAHGLTADDHYTTAYDLYLILNAALKNETFYKVITTTSYTCTYQDASGASKEGSWNTTNYYLRDLAEAPDGVLVLGGKTGTTVEAGSCLVMFSEYQGRTYVSIVLGAPSKDILYKNMTQLLELIVK